jgi:hypothetical protein
VTKRPRRQSSRARPHQIRRGSRNELEDRDTTPDREPEDAERHRPRTRKQRREDEDEAAPAKSKRALKARPILRGKPISDEEALAPASLSKMRVREAIVRIQKTMDEAPTDPGPGPGPTPDVHVDWVRSTDKSQKIERVGAHGFRVTGVATGGGKLSIGVDGLIFAINVDAGDDPARAVDRFERRLRGQLVLQRLESATSAILKRPTDEGA